MNQREMDAVAKDIDDVTDALSRIAVLKTASVQGCAMGLALGSAAYVIHSGGSEDDYMNLARAAWAKARKQHARGG